MERPVLSPALYGPRDWQPMEGCCTFTLARATHGRVPWRGWYQATNQETDCTTHSGALGGGDTMHVLWFNGIRKKLCRPQRPPLHLIAVSCLSRSWGWTLWSYPLPTMSLGLVTPFTSHLIISKHYSTLGITNCGCSIWLVDVITMHWGSHCQLKGNRFCEQCPI